MEEIENKLIGIENLIVIATENQVVNYFSVKLKEKWNNISSIVVESGFSQISHENLKERFEKIASGFSKEVVGKIIIKRSIVNDVNSIVMELEKMRKTVPTLWNITGGQRFISMAITEIVKKYREDKMIYFDGNENKFYLYSYEEEEKDGEKELILKSEEILNDNEVDVETSLKLLGINSKKSCTFKIGYRDGEFFKGGNTDIQNEKFNVEINKEREKYKKFTKEYLNNGEKNRKIRIEIIKLNYGSSAERKETHKEKLNEIFDGKNNFPSYSKELVEKEYTEKSFLIGTLFEKMVLYKLLEEVERDGNSYKDKIESIYWDFSYFDESEKYKNTAIDQIDILINLKSGRLIVIECKTGNMSSDNAKSTKYTTYAISGVYGMPILIVPLLLAEIDENIQADDFEEFKNLSKAKSAANRCNLKMYGIDGIKEILDTYIGN